jgi:hypothetical protein
MGCAVSSAASRRSRARSWGGLLGRDLTHQPLYSGQVLLIVAAQVVDQGSQVEAIVLPEIAGSRELRIAQSSQSLDRDGSGVAECCENGVEVAPAAVGANGC